MEASVFLVASSSNRETFKQKHTPKSGYANTQSKIYNAHRAVPRGGQQRRSLRAPNLEGIKTDYLVSDNFYSFCHLYVFAT